MKLTRAQLYLLVWSVPVVKLAALFGVSNVTLKNRCNKFNVPVPGPGYWRQVERGTHPVRPTLEQPDDFELPQEFHGDSAVVSDLIQKGPAAFARFDRSGLETDGREGGIEPAPCSQVQEEPNSRAPADWETTKRAPTTSGAVPDPVLPVLLELAQRHAQVKHIQKLLADLEPNIRECDCLTAAALQLWVARARAEARAIDPVEKIIKFAQALVAGEQNSPWWAQARWERSTN